MCGTKHSVEWKRLRGPEGTRRGEIKAEDLLEGQKFGSIRPRFPTTRRYVACSHADYSTRYPDLVDPPGACTRFPFYIYLATPGGLSYSTRSPIDILGLHFESWLIFHLYLLLSLRAQLLLLGARCFFCGAGESMVIGSQLRYYLVPCSARLSVGQTIRSAQILATGVSSWSLSTKRCPRTAR